MYVLSLCVRRPTNPVSLQHRIKVLWHRVDRPCLLFGQAGSPSFAHATIILRPLMIVIRRRQSIGVYVRSAVAGLPCLPQPWMTSAMGDTRKIIGRNHFRSYWCTTPSQPPPPSLHLPSTWLNDSMTLDTAQRIKSELARKAKASATAAAAADIAAAEAARNGPKVTPAALAAAAARRRDNAPLVFSGDKVDVGPGPAGKEAAVRAASRPETTSTNSSGEGGSDPGVCGRGCRSRRGDRNRSSCRSGSSSRGGGEGRRGGEPGRGPGSCCGDPTFLVEREQRLNARENALRQKEEAMRRITAMMKNGDGGAGTPRRNGATIGTDGVDVTGQGAVVNPRPPRRERERPASSSALRRHAGNRRQQQNCPGSRPPSPARREISKNNNSDGNSSGGSGRPRSALSDNGKSSVVARRAKQEEDALIARCRALGAARRKSAVAGGERRKELEKEQLERQVPRAIQTPQNAPPRSAGTTTDIRARPTVPTCGLPSSPDGERRGGGEAIMRDDEKAVGEHHDRNRVDGGPARIDVDSFAAVGRLSRAAEAGATANGTSAAARVPNRPQSATAAAHRRRSSPRASTSTRPRSASTSRSVGTRCDNLSRVERWGRGAGREMESGKVRGDGTPCCPYDRRCIL